MFRQLDYQDRVLKTLDTYLDLLKDKKARSDKVVALAADNPDLDLSIPDFQGDMGCAQEREQASSGSCCYSVLAAYGRL